MASWELRGDAENASVFLVDGWSADAKGPAGEGHRWSACMTPRIVLPTPSPGTGAVTLRMHLMPFMVEQAVTSEDVWVHVDGRYVIFDPITSSKTLPGVLPASALGGATIAISVVLPGACMPSAAGAGTDRRSLGLALRRLELI